MSEATGRQCLDGSVWEAVSGRWCLGGGVWEAGTPGLDGGVEPPFIGDAFEGVRAAVDEFDVGAGDEVFDGAGDEDFIGGCECGDAGCDVDGDAADVVVLKEVDEAGVEACPDVEVEGVDGLGDFEGGTDGAGGAIEGGEEAIAEGFDFASAVAGEDGADGGIVAREEGGVLLVADFGGEAGGRYR